MATGLNITEFNSKLNSFLSALPDELVRINNGLALSAIAEVRRRLIDTGVDGSGKSLGAYSTNPLPTFFFKNKGTGSGADSRFDALVKSKQKQARNTGEKFKGVSYKEFRQLNNLPTAHVTLSFTGETLGDLGVIKEAISGEKVITTIGAKNTKTKAQYNAKGQKVGEETTEEVLDHLGERYGEDILAVNPEEEKMLEAALDDEIQKLANKFFES